MTTLPIDMKARRFEVGADEKFGMAVLIELKTPEEAKAVLAAIWEQTEAPDE